jgi:NADH:ubiquinone oxidoreductase subunit 3 (subunit A)
MSILLSPPIAFLLYIPLVMVFVLIGRRMVGDIPTSDLKRSLYSSGEEAPTSFASPGYKPFFLVALFFAILHLGILVLGSGNLNSTEAVFLGGLILALLALILG